MNIKSQGHSLILVQGHSDSTFSDFFFLETAWPIEAKLYVVPPWDGGTEVCSAGPSHITKMAVMPIYGKNLKKIFFSGTKRSMTLKLGMQHQVIEYYQICSTDDPGLSLTYFMAGSYLVPYAFVWEKDKTMDFQKLL